MSRASLKELVRGLVPRGKLASGVVVISSGSAVGQAITVLASPLIARIYGPDEFGVLAVYSGILGIITVIASLRYQLAIPLPRTDGSAINVLALALLVTMGAVLAAVILVMSIGPLIGAWTNAPALVPHLWLLPVGIALAGAYQVFNYWAIRKGDFSTIARTKVQQSCGMVVAQVGIGLVHASPFGLIVGQIIGQAAGLSRLIRNAIVSDGQALRRIRGSRIRQCARRYRDFPIYLSWAGLLNKAGSQLPLILFSTLFSPAVAGIYFFAYRITSRPAGFVSLSIRQVFFSGAALARREGRLGGMTHQAFKALIRVGFAPFVFLGIIAPELFGLMFGTEWAEAGHFVQWMVPSLIAAFVISPLTTLTAVLERQRSGVLFQAIMLAGRLGAIVTGAHYGGPLAAVACFSIVSAVIYTVFGLWIAKASGAGVGHLISSICYEAATVLPFGVILWITKPDGGPEFMSGRLLSQPGWVVLFVCVASAVIGWRSVLFFHRRARDRSIAA